MESQHTSDMNAIHDTTDENTRIMQELSSSIVEHSLMLSDYKLQQHTLNIEVKSLKNKNPTTIGTWTPPPSTLSALEALVATLQLANTTFNTLVETTSVEIPVYSEYEDQERDSFNTNVYPDVSAFNTEENDKDTNANLAIIFSEILVSVSEILDGVADHQQVETSEGSNQHVDNTQVVQLLGRIQSIEDMLLNHSMQNISDTITSLSHQIQLVSLERLESYGRNQNMTTEVLDNYSQLSNQVVIQQSEINELLMNILDMNATLSNQVMNDQVQDTRMNNVLMMQQTLNREVSVCKDASRELGSRITNTTHEMTSFNRDLETRLFGSIGQLSQRLAFTQESILTDVFSVMDDVVAINFTLASVMNFVTDMQEELRQEISSLDLVQLERMQNSVAQHNNLLNNLFEEQQQQQSKMAEIELQAASTAAHVATRENVLNNLVLEVETLNNLTQTRLNNLVEIFNNVEFGLDKRIEGQAMAVTITSQEVNMLDQRLSNAMELVTQQLSQANSTWQRNQDILYRLQRQMEGFNNVGHNTEMALMRHSMDLKSHERQMAATENVIRTITETMTLNSNQITLLTGEIMMRGDKQMMTTAFLSDMIANHTIEIEEINDHISLLVTRYTNSNLQLTTTPPTTNTTTTLSTTPSLSPPAGLAVLSSTSTEMILSWHPLPVSEADEYRIVLQNIEGTHSSVQISAVAPPVQVDNLDPGSQYLISIYAVKNNKLSPPLTGIGETAPRPSARPTTTRRPTTTTTAQPTTTTTTSTTDTNAVVLDNSRYPNIDYSDGFHCNFELPDICGFIDDTNDDFDWSRNNGSTQSSDTGPSLDHTLATDAGYYMFIEASRPRRTGHVARLISPLMEATDGKCLEFFYHMFGVGTGDLNVLFEPLDGSASTKIWEESGNHGNQWKRGRATIRGDSPFRVIFEAVRGSDYHADTALDDVIIRDGPCPTPVLQCDFTPNDLCGFTQDLDDDFDWDTNTGATSSADTGPITDHTSGTVAGKYIYLEASNPRYPAQITRISSPTMRPTTTQCLQFYYHMHGVDIGALNVYIRSDNNPNDLGNPVWTKSGPQGNDWFLGRVSIVSATSFQVVFEGVRGDDYHGDIALDDVVINDGHCDLPVCSVGRRFEDHCYKIEKDGHTYQDAANICKANGGILAAVKTQSQQDFIRDLVSGEGNRWTLFWIGIDDLAREGQFVYSDGTPLAINDAVFGAWGPGEPNDALGDEDCVNIEYASKNRLWNDVPCNRDLWFICQYPASL
uniref:uncharacterized protein LOC104266090 isoform X2 n=1 Tax=Ciona intestinalis TaxID=7719 RepID=UPI000EF52268|nr:uncharacterized protein LOC104266090 isoform X2 [Ciona intestinalis]|eukprot:XP_026692074.1 uncharacterized protein LOC104266090 isoform X2 [Ciona intestinalis]